MVMSPPQESYTFDDQDDLSYSENHGDDHGDDHGDNHGDNHGDCHADDGHVFSPRVLVQRNT